MTNKTSAQIRREFLQFFQEKDHAIVKSAPVVPRNDSTLLFTNAGMNQFKPIFLGKQEGIKKDGKLWKRAVDTQRCIRVSGKHNDLEEVGRDSYHHTFFEMLGNWSFGDYFKDQAAAFAWELLVDQWDLEPERLYATVFEGDKEEGLPADEEARQAWESKTGIASDHILEGNKKDNFWEMGDTGPCGPCSEVHIDLRSTEERKKIRGADLVNKDHPKVMEVWNLVFIQFDRQPGGELKKLPAQHVDTGMGFERMCAILQNKTSNYDTDLFTPLLDAIAKLADVPYKKSKETDIAMQVIADHIRSVGFAIADGAAPSNEGRGFVVRRILRRAVRYGWEKLNLKEPFFYKLVPVLASQFAEVFPVLDKQQEYVMKVIKAEEESFLNTLGEGIKMFQQVSQGKEVIPGKTAFKLHDTYGFPIDLTRLMAEEKGLEVDMDGFEQELQKQQERGRESGQFAAQNTSGNHWTTLQEGKESTFVGYDKLQTTTQILAFQKDGEQTSVILEETPFYAESGGQTADTGIISRGDDTGDDTMKVLDVQKSDRGFIHRVDHLPDSLEGEWHAEVDREQRLQTRKHHSATHLLHAALRRILGDHVAQKGSLVDDHHLRFDFSHYEPVGREQLNEIEEIVNCQIQRNIPRGEERHVPIQKAKEQGATMLFGEKYGDEVRVITFDPEFSMELCGGTHAEATGEIGYFRIIDESGTAAGVRRIEAVVGRAADELLRNEKDTLSAIKKELGNDSNLVSDIHQILQERKQLQKEKEQLLHKQSSGELDQHIKQAEEIRTGVLLVTGEINNADPQLLKELGYEALEKEPKGSVIVLGARESENQKAYLVVSVAEDLIEQKGIKAGELVRTLGKILGGGGGGQPHIATAGGHKPEKLEDVFDEAKELINEQLDSTTK
jgi:alanyl-tRNA synthetase